ncbi:MmcQ/YjbR family DNA-binding protein [Actinomadura verrucosospora]|uniref:Phosphoribosylglycinamide formyltransferase n=1 Tax=Actinomadura verrucosospora TaxID=46165 RepID=A0A7D3ZJ99_ACTVE|nr:MmcQ/YjbR family DNA-binding protein [Actinomadura verrucosospora]QKG19622.1 phosphoribosylglycinamide formyltransferase [Actinomadura verrucosospora]
MVTLDDIRRSALALPETEEATHFRLPSFKVRGRPFAGVEKGEATAVFSVTEEEAAAAVAADPAVFEEVWRTAGTRIFVGLRADLAKVTGERVAELVEHAWRNKAPKRVVAAYDAR